MANGRPRTLPTGHPSVPPWQYSQSLGGEFVYKPSTDELVLRDGRHFARPQQIPRTSLVNASWNGPLPFQYIGSPPTAQPSRPPWIDSTAFQFSGSQISGSPPTTYPSQPLWHNNASLGGEFYYNPQSDEVVLRDGSRFPRPRHIPGHTLLYAAWVDPNRDPSSISGGSGPHLLGGSREQTELTGRSHPRSMDPVGMEIQALTPRKDPIARGTAQERSKVQAISSGGLYPRTLITSPSMQEELFPHFRLRSRKFFNIGRVFLVLWSEPAGDRSSVVGPNTVINHFGAKVFSKVRRFVVIRESDGYSSAVPITTYGGQGVAKVRIKKSEHAIVYTGRTEPRIRTNELPRRGETGMQPVAIRVDPDSPTEQLDPMSRIHFGGVTTIHHNIRVKSFGFVNSASLGDLQWQFRNVWGLSMNNPVERNGESRGDRQDRDRGKNGDSKEEDDDDEEDEESDDEEYDEEDEEESDDDDFEEVQHEEKPKEPPHKSVSQSVDQSSKDPATSKEAEKTPTV